jgi:hypothetical protein
MTLLLARINLFVIRNDHRRGSFGSSPGDAASHWPATLQDRG